MEEMFEKGDYVIYGNLGVCEVKDITTMNLDGVPKDKLFYVLYPYHQEGKKVYTPVDNQKTVMRKIITKEKAEELLHEAPEIETIQAANDKLREEQYKECIRSCECRQLIKVIKTFYKQKKLRMAQGKKMPAMDEKYSRIAEDNLFLELSIPLETPRSDIKDYFVSLEMGSEASAR